MKYYERIRNILSCVNIPPASKVVLIYLMDKQGNNRHSWPSMETIQRDCGLRSKQTVVNAMARLCEKDLITIEKPDRPAIGKTNRYSINPAGLKYRPVQKMDGSKKCTRAGLKNGLEPVQKIDSNGSYNDPLTTQKEMGDKTAAASGSRKAQTAFENARQLYPGTKRGLATELKDFQKHKDWEQVAFLLESAIQREIEHKSKQKTAEKFCPEWKHFKTWINQRCWEQEFPDEDDNQLTHECAPEVAMALERSLMQ